MRHVRTTAILSASALAVLTTMPGLASAHGKWEDEPATAEVLLTNLNSPKGLAVTAERDLAIAQGAFSPPEVPPGPVLVYDTKGWNKGTVTPVTDPVNLVDVAISPKDGTGWAIRFDGVLVHQLADGTVVDVASIPGYQATDPDPVDQDNPPFPTESNPYGLAIAKNGDALVVDAAGNDLIRFTPEGVGTTMARFDIETISTDHLGDPTLPPTIDAEAVPTTVTVGPDGAIYVGELKGFPFRPGTSHVWRIKRNAVGAWCSVNEKDPTRSCRVESEGYTAIQDIAFDDRNGDLYVYELAADGVLAFEAGFDPTGPGFPPAVLIRSRWGRYVEHKTELVAGQLSQPGGIVVTRGNVYVTDGVFSAGRLLKIDV